MKKTVRIIFFLILLFCFPVFAGEQKGAEHIRFGIPEKTDMVLIREGFAIGYSHKYRQALWISYVLKAEDVTGKKVRRSNKFAPDPAVFRNPVKPKEYRKTGFDKGHMAPAADMARSARTMKQSFYMTNITPQLPGCNRGIWKRLETHTRFLAVREGVLMVITGPLFNENSAMMGKTGIPVPWGFYKILFDLTPPVKMIGFIIPNHSTKTGLKRFTVPVNTIEMLTGFDFFPDLPDIWENVLEKQNSPAAWQL